MKFILLGILLLNFAQNLQGSNVIQFLDDFTNTKNVIITLYNCWNKSTIKELVKINYKKFLSTHKNLSKISNFHNNLVVMDLRNCETAWSLLFEVNRTNSFRFPKKYLFLVDDLKSIEVFRNFTIYPSSDVTIAEQDDPNFKLHQVYRINANTELVWEKYGYWSSKFGLSIYLKKSPSERRHDFMGENLRVTFRISNNDTWNHFEDFRYPRIDAFSKQCYGSTKSLLEYINVTFINGTSETFGYRNDTTGEYNGIIGGIIRNEVDLTGPSVLVTHQRLEVVDFIAPQNPSEVRFVLKKPPLSYVKNIFLLALTKPVWISIVLVLSMFPIVFYYVLNTEAKEENIGYKAKFSASDVALISLEALCQQGTTTDPARFSGRILTVIFFMAFMFIFVAYSSNIVAILQLQVELKSQKELLESKLEVGLEDTNYVRVYIAENGDSIGQQLYKKKIGKNGFYKFEEGMKKMQNGFFAFHVALSEAYNYILETFTNYEICSLQEIDGYLQHLISYSATQKKSPYLEIFKMGFLKVNEYGMTQRSIIRNYVKAICHAKGASFESVGLIETRIAFLLLLYGYILALLLLLVENLLCYFNNHRKENK